MSKYGFNVNDMPAGTTYDVLPAGWYQVEIEGSEDKQTKDGTGSMIALRLKVIGPSHEGRVIFDNLNIRNRSADAERIAHQRVGEIMRACGLTTIDEAQDFIGLKLQVKLKVNGDRNEASGYKALTGSAAPITIPRPLAAPAEVGRKPWQR